MKPVYTMDFETDPFEHKKAVYPFCAGFYNGKDFDSIWHKDCAEKIIQHLSKLEPGIIFMHNGGRFDIFYLFRWLDSEMRIINGRIVQARMVCGDVVHEFRDSWAILPIALASYKKDEIDYRKLHVSVREAHRVEILSYLRGDCVYLHELVSAFRDEFSDALTIGSAAMKQMQRFHPFKQMRGYDDEKIRRQFFFGGRVECFKSGIINQRYEIYDVNSMYPFTMSEFAHPASATYSLEKRVGPKTGFVVASGFSSGGLPIRERTGNCYPTGTGTFAATIHEWNAAIECGWFRPSRVEKVYNFDEWISLKDFVTYFFEARRKAKKAGDKIHDIFYKLILNSAYGKFAQNPENYFDFAITHGQRMPEPWTERYIYNPESSSYNFTIWRKPVSRHHFYNVAIGASITGAARATLLRALSQSDGLVYCDTDSIVARSVSGVEIDDKKLGAWKSEGSGDMIAMAGKKLYACFDGQECIKMACKGSRITPEQIVEVAKGGTVVFKRDAPTFKLDGRVEWIERKIKRTV